MVVDEEVISIGRIVLARDVLVQFPKNPTIGYVEFVDGLLTKIPTRPEV